jgi:ubiquinone/menaquinone biosynthesis C-methylase UbiE
MNRFLLAIIIISLQINTTAFCQAEEPYKCGFVLKSFDDVKYNFKYMWRYFNCKEGEKIASIGASNGYGEVQISCFIENIHWTIQDINKICLNENEFSNVFKYHEKLKGKPILGQFELVLGDEHRTNLPKNIFDRAIISNAYHEMTDRKNIMTDVHLSLKPNGEVVIMESMSKQIGDKHEDCGQLKILHTELLNEMKGFGFQYQHHVRVKKIDQSFYTFSKIK